MTISVNSDHGTTMCVLPWSRPRGMGSEQPDDDNCANDRSNAADQAPGKHIRAVVPARDLVEFAVGQFGHFAVFVLQVFSRHRILLLLPTGKRYRFRLSGSENAGLLRSALSPGNKQVRSGNCDLQTRPLQG